MREILMTDVKCIRCGALTLGATQICKICEIELNPIRPSSSGAIYYPAHPPAGSTNQPGVEIRPFDGVSDVLGPTMMLFTQNFWLITKLSIVIVAPFEIFRTLNFFNIEYDWQLGAGLFVLELLCNVLIAPALIYALMQVMQTGTAPGINESYRWGFGKLPKLTLVTFISTIFIGLAFMLCFIPGIFVYLALALVAPIAILEKGSAWQAIQASFDLTQGHRWKILGASIVVLLLMLVLGLPAEIFGEYLTSRNQSFWPLQVAGAIFADIMQQSTLVLSLVTYLSIRALWSQSTQ